MCEDNIPKYINDLAESLSGGYFNFRFIEKIKVFEVKGKQYFEKNFDVHEVYYYENGEIWAWSNEPIDLFIQNKYDLDDIIESLIKASKETILRLQDNGRDKKLIDTGLYLKSINKDYITNYGIFEEDNEDEE